MLDGESRRVSLNAFRLLTLELGSEKPNKGVAGLARGVLTEHPIWFDSSFHVCSRKCQAFNVKSIDGKSIEHYQSADQGIAAETAQLIGQLPRAGCPALSRGSIQQIVVPHPDPLRASRHLWRVPHIVPVECHNRRQNTNRNRHHLQRMLHSRWSRPLRQDCQVEQVPTLESVLCVCGQAQMRGQPQLRR